MGKSSIPVSELTKFTPPSPDVVEMETTTATDNVEQPPITDEPVVTPTLSNTRIKIDRSARIVDKIITSFEAYLNADIGSSERITALNEVTSLLVDGNAKKSVLDAIYRKFVEHKNSDALHPRNALQGLQALAKDDNLRTRIFYTVMSKLASGDKSTQLNLDTVQSVLGEEFSVWASVKLESIKHRKR